MKEAPPDPRFTLGKAEPLASCRCPDGAEKTCANPDCPRKPGPDFARAGLPGDIMMKGGGDAP